MTDARRASFHSAAYLAAAAGCSLFANGPRAIAVLVWLAPLCWLRFLRTQRLLRGAAIASAVNALASVYALRGMAPIPPAAQLVMAAGIGCGALTPLVLHRALAARLPGVLAPLLLPVLETAMEYVGMRGHPFGSWGALAYTQMDALPLLQVVALTGLSGVTFLIFLTASLVDWAWAHGFAGAQVRAGVLGGAAALLLCLALGGARLRSPESDPTVLVAVVSSPLLDALKPRIDPAYEAAGPDAVDWPAALAAAAEVEADLLARTRQAARGGARLVLWPETAALTAAEHEPLLVQRGQALAQQEGIYLAMALGTLHRPAAPGGRTYLENKLVLVSPEGRTLATYLKSIPVPGGEAAFIARGDGRIPVVATRYGRVALAICFDLDFPELLRQAGRGGADLVLAPAEDWRAIDPYHAHIAALRAVENGFSLLRAARGGRSLAVDPQGRVRGAMDHFTAAAPILYAQLPVRGVRTPYSRTGDVFAWATVLAGGLLLWRALRRRHAAG